MKNVGKMSVTHITYIKKTPHQSLLSVPKCECHGRHAYSYMWPLSLPSSYCLLESTL